MSRSEMMAIILCNHTVSLVAGQDQHHLGVRGLVLRVQAPM